MQQLQAEYGTDNVLALYYHLSDIYTNPDSGARADEYEVYYIPEVDFDAVTEVIGAGTSVYDTYQPIVATRLADSTPVTMTTTGVINDPTAARADSSWVTVTFRAVEAVPYGDLRAQFVVYEDVSDVYPWTVRDMLPPVTVSTLSAPGDSIVITKRFEVSPSWDFNELHVVVFIEDLSPRLIVNAQLMPDPFDNAFVDTDHTASEMDYMGEAAYHTVLENTGVMTDTITVSVAHTELPEGVSAYQWITFFCDTTGACYFAPWDFVLESGARETLDVHVADIVGTVQGMAVTTLSAVSKQDPNSTSAEEFATFVDLPSILLVDDDGGGAFESHMRDAISNAGYTARVWDADAKGRPGATEISSYWSVFWTTANADGSALDVDDEHNMRSSLDAGGNLMLASMDYLSSRVETSPLITDYMHVDSWINNNGGFVLTGVAGNPLTDGMSLPIIGGPFPVNNSDAVVVSSPGEAIFTSPPGNKGISVEEGAHKLVFLAFPFECIKTADPDPNNQNTLIQRVLDWFQIPAGVEDAEVERLALRQNYPNPFNPVTRLAFTVPEGAGRVTLTVHNVNGQVVRTLVDEELSAGPALAVWDGTDEAGENLASGIYFAKLATGAESAFRKMTLLK